MNPNFDDKGTLYLEKENRVNLLAAKLTHEFMCSNLPPTEEDSEKVYLVYKFLNTPSEILQEGLFQMLQRQEANAYFKKLAKQLHPDKNAHPFAKEAFQKLSTALTVVKSSPIANQLKNYEIFKNTNCYWVESKISKCKHQERKDISWFCAELKLKDWLSTDFQLNWLRQA